MTTLLFYVVLFGVFWMLVGAGAVVVIGVRAKRSHARQMRAVKEMGQERIRLTRR